MSERLSDTDFPTFLRIGRFFVAGTKAVVRAVFNRKVALRLAAIIVALFVIHALLMVIWGRQLEAKFAELRARGEAVKGIELVRKIPDSRNGAVVYKRFLRL